MFTGVVGSEGAVDPCLLVYLVVWVQWIPMLQHGKIQLGEFNLCVATDNPTTAQYSQISTDTAVPYLKWIDGHKGLFKVNLSLVSSIHPQVWLLTCLLEWSATQRNGE